MTSAQSTFDLAVRAYVASDCRYAAVRFRLAAEQAQEYMDDELWFKAMVWLAEALYSVDDYTGAFSTIIDARSREPPGDGFEHWLSRKLHFKILIEWEPVKRDLERKLQDLEKYNISGRAKHDLNVMRGWLADLCGAPAKALEYYELAFFERTDNFGSMPSTIAARAAECCIFMKQFGAAGDWTNRINNRQEIEEGWVNEVPRRQALQALRLARAKHEPFSRIGPLLRHLEDLCHALDPGDSDWLLKERARVGLLNPIGGDPERVAHPSRAACRDFSSRRHGRPQRFDCALLVLDYRLACLRYCVGLPPVDDEFDEGAPSPSVLARTGPLDFGTRMRQALAALRRAQRLGAKLDSMLECGWRTEAVERRMHWIRAIAVAAAGPQHTSCLDAREVRGSG